MATNDLKKRISDLFNPITNPGGGVPSNSPLSAFMSANKSQAPVFQNPAPVSPFQSKSTISPYAQPAPVGTGAGTFGAPMSVGQPAPRTAAAPVAPATPAYQAPGGGSRAPVGGQGATGATGAAQPAVPPQWLNADGSFKTPDQIASEVGGALKGAHGVGDVGTLSLDQFGAQNKTAEQLEAEARGINNTRNDIAVGATDPYKVAADSGIAYTPAELHAIEQAYAGVYDPALNTALAKVEEKRKSDETAVSQKFDLEKMEKQFGYDKALKQTVAGGTAGSGSGGSGSYGTYVPGANPAVDAWAQRIFDGSAKITDIPAAQKGMRDAVVIALQASGNTLSGKPTSTELGKRSAQAAKDLLQKVIDGQGTSAVGGSRFFTGGSLAFPGSDKAEFQIDFQNLKDMLSLDGTKYLKGQGAVSDAERALLASAVTKLNLSQGDGAEGEFAKTLKGIVTQLEGGGDDTSALPPSMQLNGQTLYLQSDGTYE